MESNFLRKMISRALKDYLWDEEDCILSEEEWKQLENEATEQIKEENQEEAIYAIVQDVVYTYFTNK